MTPIEDRIHVTLADPMGEPALQLLQHLLVELTTRYPEEETDAAIPANIDGPGGAFVIAWLGDQSAGCGALRPMEPGVAEVKRMYVEPEARRRGVARKVLDTLESVAHERGYMTLRLETGIRQPEAIGLYESAGFRRIQCYGIYIDNPRSVCYEKRLH
jgi:GNAT superfamily N-acetyltransferase